MDIGINGSSQLGSPDITALVAHAKQVEADGFASYWIAQTGLVDALGLFTLLGAETSTIELGTAVVPTYSRHPLTMAGQGLTAQAATGGRVVLGIGLSHQPVVEDRYKQPWDPPIKHAREYLDALVPMLEEGTVAATGDLFSYHAEMVVPTSPPPSLMIAALGPQMLKMTGRRADGTILWMVGPKTITSHIAPVMNDAASEAGRPTPRIVCSLPVWVTDDEAGARDACDKMFELYGQLPSYRAMLDREGGGGPGGICVVGTEERVREQLAAIADAGATDFTAVEMGGNPDEAARTRAVLQEVAAAG